MKVLDISEVVSIWKSHVDPNEPLDSWNDYISWKTYRSRGYDKVLIDGIIYDYHKYGIIQESGISYIKNAFDIVHVSV